jgi:putative oxidoreductase
LSMLLGLYPVIGIIFLLIFFIPVSFWMHAFWTTTDSQQKMIERINFMKNMALIGALLMLFMIARPWPVSI